MPTSFELSHLLLISILYLLTLFGVAWVTEKGLLPRALLHHPAVYTLSLGVYASAWAFYGTVGLAYQYGYGFLTYYLGICGAFLLAPVLLSPILRITRTYQLSSLADLFAFRFRSTLAGTLTTLFMLIGVLPLLALQIQAVADSVQILTQESGQDSVALGFCVLITLFAILFGARHISTREKHEGLVIAIAFESLVKLIAIGMVGLYALYVVFDGPQGLESWLTNPAAGSPLAYTAAGVLCRGYRHAAHVSHGFYREYQPTLDGRRQLGPTPVPAADQSCRSADPLGRFAPERADQSGIFHPRPGHGVGGQLVDAGGLCRRSFGGQRPDYRRYPGAVRHGAQPSGAAGLSAQRRQQHLPLAIVDAAHTDRGDHHGQLRWVPNRTWPIWALLPSLPPCSFCPAHYQCSTGPRPTGAGLSAA